VDGTLYEVQFAVVGTTPLYHLLLAGESWTIAADAEAGDTDRATWVMGAAGERLTVEVVGEQAREDDARAARPPAPVGGATLRAPMPGMVVRVEVSEGQQVDAGAALVVVEAMKMENDLRAQRPGVVKRVHVRAGEAVEKGAPLVTLDAAKPSS
jgi:biotin carboxyl carrier protein